MKMACFGSLRVFERLLHGGKCYSLALPQTPMVDPPHGSATSSGPGTEAPTGSIAEQQDAFSTC
jgi:hypothetical protein